MSKIKMIKLFSVLAVLTLSVSIAVVLIINNSSATENSGVQTAAQPSGISAEEQIEYNKLVREKNAYRNDYLEKYRDSDKYADVYNKSAELNFDAEDEAHNAMLGKVIDVIDKYGKNQKNITKNDKNLDSYRTIIEYCIDLYSDETVNLSIEERTRLKMELTEAYYTLDDPLNDPDGHSKEITEQIAALIPMGFSYDSFEEQSGYDAYEDDFNKLDRTIGNKVTTRWLNRNVDFISMVQGSPEYEEFRQDKTNIETAKEGARLARAETHKEMVAIVQKYREFEPDEALYDGIGHTGYDKAYREFIAACKDILQERPAELTDEERYILMYEIKVANGEIVDPSAPE